MQEYTIAMSFSVETANSNYNKIKEFAEDLSNKIMDDDSLTYHNGIEIVEAIVENVEDHNDYDGDEDYDNNYDDDDFFDVE